MLMKIGDITSELGVSHRTLHYWEDIGLINSSRAENDYRYYDEKNQQKIRQILVLRKLRLPLKQIIAEHESDVIMSKFINDIDLFKIYPSVKFYGFNNPKFGQDGEFIQHQYEVWATIPHDLEVSKPLIKKYFDGGLYVAYTSKPVSFDDWKPFGDWLSSNEEFEYDGNRSYRDDTSKDHKVRCSGWGCLEEHFNSYNLYGLNNKKHILSHIDFLIPIKEKEVK